MTWTPVQKLSIGAGTALLVLALFGAVAFFAVSRLASQHEDVADVNTAIAKIDQLLAASADAERAGTEFMMTGSQEALDGFDQARGQVEEAFDVLRQRAEDRPRERSALDSVGPLIGQRFTTLSAGIAMRRRQGADAAIKFARADAGRVIRGTVLPLLKRIRDEELVVLAEKTRLQTKHGKTASSVILVGSVFAFLLAAIAFTPIRPGVAARLTRRLTTPIGMPSIPEFGESFKEAVRLSSDRLARLEQLAFAVDTPGSAEAIGDALIVRGLGGTTSAAALVARRDGNAWHVMARRSATATVGSVLPADVTKPLADAARTSEPVTLESQPERDKLYPGLPSLGAAPEVALIVVPLIANGRVGGALVLTFDGPRLFGDDERAFLATLGRLGGQALERV